MPILSRAAAIGRNEESRQRRLSSRSSMMSSRKRWSFEQSLPFPKPLQGGFNASFSAFCTPRGIVNSVVSSGNVTLTAPETESWLRAGTAGPVAGGARWHHVARHRARGRDCVHTLGRFRSPYLSADANFLNFMRLPIQKRAPATTLVCSAQSAPAARGKTASIAPACVLKAITA